MSAGGLLMLTIEYFGQLAYRLSSGEFKVIVDPGIVNEKPLIPPDLETDAVGVTHIHKESFGNSVELANKQKALFFGNQEVINYARSLNVKPWLLRQLEENKPYERPNFKVTSYFIRHGPPGADSIPTNSSFYIELENIKIAHLGHGMGIGPYDRIPVDVLLLPINEKFSFKPQDALNAVNVIHPKLVIPMGYEDKSSIEYFAKNLKYFAPDAKYELLEPGEKLNCYLHVGHEFIIER